VNHFPKAALTALASVVLLTPVAAWAADGPDDEGPAPQAGALAPDITAVLEKSAYAPGDVMVLTVTENIDAAHSFDLADSLGVAWIQLAVDDQGATYVAMAPDQSGTVSVSMTRLFDQAVVSVDVPYIVLGSDVPGVPGGVPAWPGHVPGKFYLGMSCGVSCADKERELGQPFGVRRMFEKWGDWAAVSRDIQGEHSAGRLPWVSVKPPGGAPGGWAAIANGSVDADIVALAETLKATEDQPALLTFHHEPSNDGSEADGALWAAAYAHFHDVLAAEGALVNVADPPIVGEWLFNPRNHAKDPSKWVTEDVLQRAPFLGVDLYENRSGETFADRLPRVLDWLAAHGHPDMMIGIGETGSTDAAYPGTSAVQWMNDSLAWVAAHTDKVGVVSYFNSTANSKPDVYWPLDESSAKLDAFRSWLADPVTVE
jgi:hypothetical protein